MVFFENPNLELWEGETGYNAIVIAGGQDALGNPIGEVNVFKWPAPNTNFQPVWDKVTYTYPQPTSYAACAQRTWFGDGIAGEIAGITYYGGKKDAAGGTNDDVWFFDTDTLQWYFVLDLFEASRYGAAFTSYDNHPGNDGWKDGILFYGGFGVGASEEGQMCWYVGVLHSCAELHDAGDAPPPASLGVLSGTWARMSTAPPAGNCNTDYLCDVGLAAYGFDSAHPTRVYVGHHFFIAHPTNPVHTMIWEYFDGTGYFPTPRYYPGFMCIDEADLPDCRIYTSSSNPTRFVVWSGDGTGGYMSDVYMVTFNRPISGSPPPGCGDCPPPVPI